MKYTAIRKQNFIQGALILIIGNFIVKIIGALFKIPLANLLHEEGMGIFNTAYQIYAVLFAISTTGLPIAISKMISQNIALGEAQNTKRIFKIAITILSSIGFVCMLFMFFGSNIIASAIQADSSANALRMISPSIFFITIVASYRGFFQGMQNMLPTALSEIIEAFGKLIIGYLLAYLLITHSVEDAASGAVLGVSAGTLLGAALMFFIYKLISPQIYINASNKKYSRSKIFIVKELLKIAIPITIGASVTSITSVVDTALLRMRLQQIVFTPKTAQTLSSFYGQFTEHGKNFFEFLPYTLQLTKDASNWLFGAYSGYALTLFFIAPSLTMSIGMSLVPTIVKSFTLGDFASANNSAQTALRITTVIALPLVVIFSCLAEPILMLAFNKTSALHLLTILSPTIIFMTTVTITTSILQATGRVMIPFWNMLIGLVIKICSTYVLVGIPSINILGAPISTGLCYIFVAIANLCAINKHLHFKYNFKNVFLKPLFCAIVMAVMLILLQDPLGYILQNEKLGTVANVLIGGLCYILMLFLIGVITKLDMDMIIKRKK